MKSNLKDGQRVIVNLTGGSWAATVSYEVCSGFYRVMLDDGTSIVVSSDKVEPLPYDAIVYYAKQLHEKLVATVYSATTSKLVAAKWMVYTLYGSAILLTIKYLLK